MNSIKKGIILAGGHGKRLQPLTYITNKHLLPIYDKPMIEYPLATLTMTGIKEILIVSGREHAGHFINYLGSGKERGLNFSYKVQESADGIAHALGLAKDFIDVDEKFAVILGDNIFEDNFSETFEMFANEDKECRLFQAETNDARRFGVYDPEINKIIEKPDHPKTNMAIAGIYLYDSQSFDVIEKLKPSSRGELEITDLNNWYLSRGKTSISNIKGFWSDAGTFDSMLLSSNWASRRIV